jgi:hypothetical protein
MSKIVKAFAIDEETRTLLVDQEMIDFTINDAVEQIINAGMMNDDEGIFFQRQLEYIQAQSYDVLYPELKGRTLFALNTEGGEGINVITYRSYDKRGETQIIAGKATDLPRGDINGREYSISVRTLGNAFGYSRQELASAKVTGMPLEARKAEASRKSYEEKVNQIIFFGSPDDNLHGFFNGPVGAPALLAERSTVAGGSLGSNATQWRSGDKTPDDIIADLNSALVDMYESTLQIFRPNMILMSVADKQLLMNTPRSLQSDMSILNWFLQNNDFISSADQIKDINEIKGIYPDTGTGGGGTITDAITGTTIGRANGFTVIAMAEENMRAREPFPYMHLPVQLKGLEFEINCYGRFAGVETIRPAAISHFCGI